MLAKKRIYPAIALLLGLAIVPTVTPKISLPQRPGVISSCPTVESPTNAVKQIHPARVVIKPWKGRHHVYAVFEVPPGYQPSQFFEVSVEEDNSYCGMTGQGRYLPADIRAASPKNQVVGRLRTRTTLWLILTGRLSQLTQPTNWMMPVQKQRYSNAK